MNKYDIIFEALQEKLENGELTMEEAEALNDAAYNRYVTEANAYNKFLDKRSKAIDKKDRDIEIYSKLLKNDGSKSDDNVAQKIGNLRNDKRKLNNNEHNACTSVKEDIENRKKAEDKVKELKRRGYSKKEIDSANSSNLTSGTGVSFVRDQKKDWMRRHGDKGQSPEEKYKKDRYLNAQKELRQESVELTEEEIFGIKNDLKLSVYEAADAGFFTNDEMSVLFELID